MGGVESEDWVPMIESPAGGAGSSSHSSPQTLHVPREQWRADSGVHSYNTSYEYSEPGSQAVDYFPQSDSNHGYVKYNPAFSRK